MIRTGKRLWICRVLLALNLLFIWGNSLLPGNVSGAISDWVRDILASLFTGTGGEGTGGGFLRKLAHFTEFACLGMCLRWLYGMVSRKKRSQFLLPLLWGFLTACADETIQFFVPNRGPGIADVFLDTCGVFLGIWLLSFLHTVLYEKSKEKTQ